MRARWMAVSVLAAAGTILAGCQSTVDGNPQGNGGNPTEPTFPTTQPSRAPTTTTPTSSARSPTAASPPETLAPQNGYVFVTTTSGQTRCQLSVAEVDCEAPFTTAPVVDGQPANGVRVTADGQLSWVVGNLGDIPVVTMEYRTYAAQGWTIAAGEDGTRFTNDRTAHGMFVAIGGVQAF